MLRVRYKAAVDRVIAQTVPDCRASAAERMTENIADLAVPVFVIDTRNPQTLGAS
jgi:hypothetical protein